MSDGGKGSKPRPYSVTQTEFDNNWDRIFGKKNEKISDTNTHKDDTSQADQSSESGGMDVRELQGRSNG